MATTPCPNCQTPLEDPTKPCPNCGNYIGPPPVWYRNFSLLSLVVLLLVEGSCSIQNGADDLVFAFGSIIFFVLFLIIFAVILAYHLASKAKRRTRAPFAFISVFASAVGFFASIFLAISAGSLFLSVIAVIAAVLAIVGLVQNI